MAVHDPLGDGESEPGPAAGCARRPIEPLEDVRHVLGSDARAVVLDDERRPAPIGPHRHPDPAVGRAVTDGVVDQDHHQLAEAGGIACHHRSLRIDLDPDPAVGRGLAHRRGAVGRHVAEVDRDVLQRHGPRIGAGEQQQVLDDRGHVADLVIDVLERRADRRDGLVAVPLEMLHAAPDDGQRRAQLVARIGRELALAP